jgi:hypothetical protein
MTLIERIERKGQEKLLAIDGGGIRGVLALEVLQRIEDRLKAKSGRSDFHLADYFDYIAGTSTGGIIAAGLSIGMSVRDILTFYQDAGAQMFVKANLLRRLRYKFEDEPLAKKLKEVFEVSTKLGSDRLRTLLLLVMRNASTDSPWPISNNPYAKYNDGAREDCNLAFPLWQLVRASTAAPTFFLLARGDRAAQCRPRQGEGVRFRRWRRHDVQQPGVPDVLNGHARPLLGKKAGCALANGRRPDADRFSRNGHEPRRAARPRARRNEPSFQRADSTIALMFAALNEQDLLCRVFGDCRAGDPIDRELDDLAGSAGPLSRDQKLFTYLRYNAELTREGLDGLGCRDIEPRTVQKLDSIDGIPDLRQVGKRVAEIKVREQHFAGFMPS